LVLGDIPLDVHEYLFQALGFHLIWSPDEHRDGWGNLLHREWSKYDTLELTHNELTDVVLLTKYKYLFNRIS
jgi:hypothetical protein